MRWRLDGFQKISFWENKDLAKLFTRVAILTEEYAQLSRANRFDNPSLSLLSQRSFPGSFAHYKAHLIIPWQKSRLLKSI